VLFIPGEAFLAPARTRHPTGGARGGAPGAHRHPDDAGLAAAHRAVRMAAGGVVGERPRGVRCRAGALRAHLRPWPARGPGGQGAVRRGGRLQPDGRVPGEPGPGQRPPAAATWPGRGRPGGPADRGGDHKSAIRTRTDRLGGSRAFGGTGARGAGARGNGRPGTGAPWRGRGGDPTGMDLPRVAELFAAHANGAATQQAPEQAMRPGSTARDMPTAPFQQGARAGAGQQHGSPSAGPC
jgi:hypothetical protein